MTLTPTGRCLCHEDGRPRLNRPDGPRPTTNTVIRIGVLTPHGVPGPEVEFAAMAPGRLATRVVRVTAEPSGRLPSAAALDELTAATAAPVVPRGPVQSLSLTGKVAGGTGRQGG